MNLNRLQKILNGKFLDMLHGDLKPFRLATALESWERLCDRLDITRVEHTDYEPGGQVFEDFVALDDPSPAGNSLEMTKETALKILTLGLP